MPLRNERSRLSNLDCTAHVGSTRTPRVTWCQWPLPGNLLHAPGPPPAHPKTRGVARTRDGRKHLGSSIVEPANAAEIGDQRPPAPRMSPSTHERLFHRTVPFFSGFPTLRALASLQAPTVAAKTPDHRDFHSTCPVDPVVVTLSVGLGLHRFAMQPMVPFATANGRRLRPPVDAFARGRAVVRGQNAVIRFGSPKTPYRYPFTAHHRTHRRFWNP